MQHSVQQVPRLSTTAFFKQDAQTMKRICSHLRLFQSWAIEESSSDHCVSRAGLAAETSKEAEKGIATFTFFTLYKSDSCAHPVGKEREILPYASPFFYYSSSTPRRLTVLCEARRIDKADTERETASPKE